MIAQLQAALFPFIGKQLTDHDVMNIIRQVLPSKPLPLAEPLKFGDVTFSHERFVLVVEEIEDLCLAHWAETEQFRNDVEMMPDWPSFFEKEARGQYTQFVIRNAASEAIGHMGTSLYRSNQHNALIAEENALYVKPEYRDGHIAFNFGTYCVNTLKAFGVDELHCTTKPLNNANKLLERLGFGLVAHQYVKILRNV